MAITIAADLSQADWSKISDRVDMFRGGTQAAITQMTAPMEVAGMVSHAISQIAQDPLYQRMQRMAGQFPQYGQAYLQPYQEQLHLLEGIKADMLALAQPGEQHHASPRGVPNLKNATASHSRG